MIIKLAINKPMINIILDMNKNNNKGKTLFFFIILVGLILF
ncbi:hypothetical protein K661_01004 [Piscirickettsia salmonis LF-89 = ATCC VR-1361]|nr:hypothetical protein K661_01004 [Piscirickettsia salmonis LF-89 = ATCC VR-1361]